MMPYSGGRALRRGFFGAPTKVRPFVLRGAVFRVAEPSSQLIEDCDTTASSSRPSESSQSTHLRETLMRKDTFAHDPATPEKRSGDILSTCQLPALFPWVRSSAKILCVRRQTLSLTVPPHPRLFTRNQTSTDPAPHKNRHEAFTRASTSTHVYHTWETAHCKKETRMGGTDQPGTSRVQQSV